MPIVLPRPATVTFVRPLALQTDPDLRVSHRRDATGPVRVPVTGVLILLDVGQPMTLLIDTGRARPEPWRSTPVVRWEGKGLEYPGLEVWTERSLYRVRLPRAS